MTPADASTHAVSFLRARYLDSDGPDHDSEDRHIALQRRMCEQTAARLGVTIIREYVEHGGTGAIAHRPAARRMLDELLALHDARFVIVASLDRLARSTEDLAAIDLDLASAGAELVVADEQARPRMSASH